MTYSEIANRNTMHKSYNDVSICHPLINDMVTIWSSERQFEAQSASNKTKVLASGAEAFANTMFHEGEEAVKGIGDGVKNSVTGVGDFGLGTFDLCTSEQKRAEFIRSAQSTIRSASNYAHELITGQRDLLSDLDAAAVRWENLSARQKAAAGTEAIVCIAPVERLASAVIDVTRASKLAEADAKFEKLFARMDQTAEKYRKSGGSDENNRLEYGVLNPRTASDVVKQSHEASCVSACGEMLSEGKLKQEALIAKLGAPAELEHLARELGPGWRGGVLDEQNFARAMDFLVKRAPFAAELRSQKVVMGHRIDMGHVVVVDGINKAGQLMIRDPLYGIRYEMRPLQFLSLWSFRVVAKVRSVD